VFLHHHNFTWVKGKAIPLQALTGPEGSRRLRLPDFKTISKLRWQALHTGHLYPQETFLVLISVRDWVDPQDHNAAESIMSMKNSNDFIGNKSRDLPVCSAVFLLGYEFSNLLSCEATAFSGQNPSTSKLQFTKGNIQSSTHPTPSCIMKYC
jgi:hypothetical protein